MKDDGRANCILEICCAPGSANQRAALAIEIENAGLVHADRELVPNDQAHAIAAWIADTFDLAPKGSLVAFKREIARLARQG